MNRGFFVAVSLVYLERVAVGVGPAGVLVGVGVGPVGVGVGVGVAGPGALVGMGVPELV